MNYPTANRLSENLKIGSIVILGGVKNLIVSESYKTRFFG